jgi:WD40 repeat protein
MKGWKINALYLGLYSSEFPTIFSPDGQQILVPAENGTAQVWPIPKTYTTWIDTLHLAPLSQR